MKNVNSMQAMHTWYILICCMPCFLYLIICQCFLLHTNFNVYCIIICVWCANILACHTNILTCYMSIQFLNDKWCEACQNLNMLRHYSFMLYQDSIFLFSSLIFVESTQKDYVVSRFVSDFSITSCCEKLSSLAVACCPATLA